jgi:phospholipid/cholesterol/gamma-HCH transport system substrate-binding protein
VTGLSVGAAVRYSGVQIGRVDEITIDPRNIERVRVTIQTDRPDIIREDAVATLELQGITGYAFVQIVGGTKDSPVLYLKEGERHPVIASVPSRLEKVFSNAPELLDRAIVIADRLTDVLSDKNRTAIAETLENLRTTTAALGGTGGQIDGILVEGAATMKELRKTLVTVNNLVDQVDRTLTAKGGVTDKLDSTLQGFDTAAKRLSDATTKIDQVVSEMRPGLRDFSQRGLSDATQLLADARQLVSGLTRLVAEIERDPARFLFGDRREGYRPR